MKKEKNKCFIVYMIKNNINQQIYIGQTTDSIQTRWDNHFYLAKKIEPSHRTHFQNSLNLYKKKGFNIRIIWFCESIDELNLMEKYWIKYYNTFKGDGYNSTEGGRNGERTDETKKRISNALMGNQYSKGKKLSKEHILILKQSNTGLKRTDEHKKAISESKIGIQRDKEMIERTNCTRRMTIVKRTNRHSKYKGVLKRLRKNGKIKWRSIIYINGKCKELGCFATEIEAALAYNEAVDKYWGGQGYKNVITD